MIIMGDLYKSRNYRELGDHSRTRYSERQVRIDHISSLYSSRPNVDTTYDEIRAKAKERFAYK